MLENTGTFLLGIGPNNFRAASSLAGLFVSEGRDYIVKNSQSKRYMVTQGNLYKKIS